MNKLFTMRRLIFFTVIASLSTSTKGTLYGADNTCDFVGLRLDNQLLRVLARLPENRAFGPQRFNSYWPGVRAYGPVRVRAYGPLFPYCINGSRMLQAEFLNEGDTMLSLPWKACCGREGRFKLRTSLPRFTVQFRVSHLPGNEVRLQPMGRIVPVTTDGIRVIVEGAGSEVRTLFEVLSALFPNVVKEVWYW